MNTAKKSNTIIIGVGDTGGKITKDLIGKLNSDYLWIKKYGMMDDSCKKTLEIDVGNVINPSQDQIRKAFLNITNKLWTNFNQNQSVVIIGNLASNFGSAILPVLAKLLRDRRQREVICFAILPFSFEKAKLFRCGVSLAFLSKFVKNIIVIDNDAILRNDIEVQLEKYFGIINQAISDIITESFRKCFPIDFNIIVTNANISLGLNDAFIDTMASITKSLNISNIQKCSLYLYQTSETISVIRNIVESTGYMIPNVQNDVNLITNDNHQTRCHMLVKTAVQAISAYDPLDKFISKNNILDFEPEIAINSEINLEMLRDLELDKNSLY